jgi:DNA-binding NtrC family response regulator
LQREINTGRFRTDLYYRLAVIEIRLPPLRERREDLSMLAENLLTTLGASGASAAQLRSPEALAALERHAWPGNVRELRNHIERSLASDQPAPLSTPPEDVLAAVDPDIPLRIARDRYVRVFERHYLRAVLAKHNGNVSRAARAAGVARVHFYRLLARAGTSS